MIFHLLPMDVSSIMVRRMAITDAKSIISQWPTRQAFADAVGQPVETVHKWAQNNSFPSWHHPAVLRACASHGVEIDPVDLMRMSAARRNARQSGAAA